MKISNILFQDVADAENACIGILGGGGKTALLHRLGDELSQSYSRVILSSLTKAGISSIHPVHLYHEFEPEAQREQLLENNPLYIMGEPEHAEKLLGVNEDQLQHLFEASDLTIFECDGARKRPIKAHQPFDPNIPDYATHAIIVVGADAVGARVDGKMVHRPELFRELWDVNANFVLDPGFITKVITSQYGYMQKVPPDVPVTYFVNKADTFPDEARTLAKTIRRLSNAPVFYGSIEQGDIKQAP